MKSNHSIKNVESNDNAGDIRSFRDELVQERLLELDDQSNVMYDIKT